MEDRELAGLHLEELLAELEERTGCSRANAALGLARDLPLLHRNNDLPRLLRSITEGNTVLEPGTGSANRRVVEPQPCTYFWVGSCAYGREKDGVKLVLVWGPEAERDGVVGLAAPWDTAGLCNAQLRTLGQAVSEREAVALVDKYSLPGVATGGHERDRSFYREYLAAVLESCFGGGARYLDAKPPIRGYPGWIEPRQTPPEAPHHTFELRRRGTLKMANDLIAVIVDATLFANDHSGLRTLRQWVRSQTAWRAEEQPYLVDTRREKVAEFASKIVREFLKELGHA